MLKEYNFRLFILEFNKLLIKIRSIYVSQFQLNF